MSKKDESQNSDEKQGSNNSKDDKDLNRRKVIKKIIGASSLLVANPFLMRADSSGQMVTVTPTSSSTPTPTPTSSSIPPTPSASTTPTPTPTSSSIPPTPSASTTPTPTPTSSTTPTPTPTSSIIPPTPSATSTPTPTPSSSGGALPVKLSEFSARAENEKIKLSWRTESELNNDWFEIERGDNGYSFIKIGRVKGVGNSNESINYNYLDTTVETNKIYYYRLKQIDYDGTVDYSNIVSAKINIEEQIKVKDIYPNVVKGGFVNIEIISSGTNTAEIYVHNMSGQLITKKKTAIHGGHNVIRMDLQNAGSGMYIVNVNFAKGKRQTQKFVIKK